MKAVVARPTSAARPARQAKSSNQFFGITVKPGDLWETGPFVHLDRFISPRNLSEITGAPDALHTRIHTSVPAARKKYWRKYLA